MKKPIKVGDVIALPCGAAVEVDGLNAGLVSATIYSDLGLYVAGRKVKEVELNFWPDNIRTLIETLERIEEVVCPRK